MQLILFPAHMRARGVEQLADGEDRVGISEVIRGALKGCGGARGGTSTTVGHPVVAGTACHLVQQGHPREVC
jgi:hypothetical protein